MKKIALQSLLAASVLGITGTAAAQNCPPGSWLCADVQIGGGMVAPPVVVQQPQVVYQPPPPPQVYYVQQPQQVVVTTTPTYTYTQTQTYSWVGFGREQAVGIGGHFIGMGFPSQGGSGSSAGMAGAGGSLRFRSHPFLATELAVDFLGGHDYNNDLRSEVPVTVSELFYFNPQNRFQFYGLAGLGGSFASVTYETSHGGTGSANYGYLGGQAGLGFEWQLSPHFSLYSDVRGFLRTRIDPNTQTNPEFTRLRSDGTTQTSNTSVGATFQVGGLLYF